MYTIEASSDQCVMPGGDYVYAAIELRHGSSDSVCGVAERCRVLDPAQDVSARSEDVCWASGERLGRLDGGDSRAGSRPAPARLGLRAGGR